MARKSKQAGGHNPLTYYERTKKFASSEYGTKEQRLAGHSQYQLGDCALSLTSLAVIGGNNNNNNNSDGKVSAAASSSASASAASASASASTTTTTTTALCSPSGYLYSEDAILEYLLIKTREIKDQQAAYERQVALQQQAKINETVAAANKRKADFIDLHHSQKEKKSTTTSNSSSSKQQPHLLLAQEATSQGQDALKHASYWLAQSQPKTIGLDDLKPPADLRPPSPHSQQPLRRKDLWPVTLQWTNSNTASSSDKDTKNKTSSTTSATGAPPQLVCSVSGKVLHTQSVTAYWTTNNYKKITISSSTSSSSHGPGKLVLTSVYNEFIQNTTNKCPETNRTIKVTRILQKSGSSFAASGQACQVKQYRPTIT